MQTVDEFLKEFWSDFGNIMQAKRRVYKTYIMKDLNTSTFKIGRAIDPMKRLNVLKVANVNVELFAVCGKNVETILHKEYASKRIDREWFNLSEREIADILVKYNFARV